MQRLNFQQKAILFIIAGGLLVAIIPSVTPRETQSDDFDYTVVEPVVEDTDSYVDREYNTGDTADRTFSIGETSVPASNMDARERELYAANPESYGYTDADLEFMQEHGVTPREMRTMETLIGNPD